MPAKRHRILFHLFGALDSHKERKLLNVFELPKVTDVLKLAVYGKNLLDFNVNNATGSYRLELDSPSDYMIAESILLLDKWEMNLVRQNSHKAKFGAPKISWTQNGTTSGFRNEKLRHTSLVITDAFQPPRSGSFEFDFVSAQRPPPFVDFMYEKLEKEEGKIVPVNDENKANGDDENTSNSAAKIGILTESQLAAIEEALMQYADFPLHHIRRTLHCLADRFYLTCLQLRRLLQFFSQTLELKIALVQTLGLGRTVDWFLNEKIVRCSFRREEWYMEDEKTRLENLAASGGTAFGKKRRKKRSKKMGLAEDEAPPTVEQKLGKVFTFPFVQPENSHYTLDFRVPEDRCVLWILMQFEKYEPGDNLIAYCNEWEPTYPKGGLEQLPRGMQGALDSWEQKMPEQGLIRMAYVCSPECTRERERMHLAAHCGFFRVNSARGNSPTSPDTSPSSVKRSGSKSKNDENSSKVASREQTPNTPGDGFINSSSPPMHVLINSIIWWCGIEAPPKKATKDPAIRCLVDFVELGVLLLHRFPSAAHAFQFLDVRNLQTGQVLRGDWHKAFQKMGVRIEKHQKKINNCFQFFDRGGDGTICWQEFMVVNDLWNELVLGLREFYQFLQIKVAAKRWHYHRVRMWRQSIDFDTGYRL